MKKILILSLVISVVAVFPAKAQLVIKNNGKAIVGGDTRPEDDMYDVLSMSIQGKYGEYNAGTKLAFGDFGRYEHNGWNVFIGEYNTYDSDVLWLHGKKGFKVTAFNSSYLAAEWYYSGWSLPRFTLHDGVWLDRLFVSSDDGHKSSIENINYALPKLMLLHGVKYNYQPIENEIPVGYVGEIDRSIDSSAKGRVDRERSTSIMQTRADGDTRYGLVTAEIIDLFPEIVEYDSLGNQYVNYLELIPVMVSAFKELYYAIEDHGVILNAVEDYEAHRHNMQSDTTADNQSKGSRRQVPISPDTTGAVLFQNSPNPFSSSTMIEYYVPNSATNANLFVFNLIGELLQTYPIGTFGSGQVTINGSTLNAGMYIYSLVVDEQIIDTKRMILTK